MKYIYWNSFNKKYSLINNIALEDTIKSKFGKIIRNSYHSYIKDAIDEQSNYYNQIFIKIWIILLIIIIQNLLIKHVYQIIHKVL